MLDSLTVGDMVEAVCSFFLSCLIFIANISKYSCLSLFSASYLYFGLLSYCCWRWSSKNIFNIYFLCRLLVNMACHLKWSRMCTKRQRRGKLLSSNFNAHFFIVPHKFPLTLVWRTCIRVCLYNTVIVKSTKCSFIHWNVSWILITPLKKLKSWHFKLAFGCKFLRFSHSPINTAPIYISVSLNEKWTLNPRVFMVSAFLPFTVFQ